MSCRPIRSVGKAVSGKVTTSPRSAYLILGPSLDNCTSTSCHDLWAFDRNSREDSNGLGESEVLHAFMHLIPVLTMQVFKQSSGHFRSFLHSSLTLTLCISGLELIICPSLSLDKIDGLQLVIAASCKAIYRLSSTA